MQADCAQSGLNVQMAEFDVHYKAIVYRPFKGEVLEGVVSNVNKVSPAASFCAFHAQVYLDGLLCGCWAATSIRINTC